MAKPSKASTQKVHDDSANADRLWIITTHPDQVKDKGVMRDIRAHALRSTDYHQGRAKKSKPPVPPTTFSQPLPKRRKRNIPASSHPPTEPDLDARRASHAVYTLPSAYPPLPFASRYPLGDLTPCENIPPRPPSRNLTITDLLNPIDFEDASPPRLVELDDADSDDEDYASPSVKSQVARSPGDGIDPFKSLPQFKNPRLSVEKLQYFCTLLHNFNWGPQHDQLTMNSRLVFLSSVSAGAAYYETLYGVPGESLTSVAVKTELISMINERLRDPALQASDETIAAVCHMINFEVYHSEPGLVTHIRGLEQLVLQRGGLFSLTRGGENALSKTSQLLSHGLRFHSRVMGGLFVNELQPDPRWQNFMPPPNASIRPLVPLESPVHGIRSPRESSYLAEACAPETFKILCDMHDLTTMILDQEDDIMCSTVEEPKCMTSGSHSRLIENAFAAKIYSELVALPSASLPGSSVTDDWIYECCRLLSIIYATAIVAKVPFSLAVPIAAAASQTPFLLRTLSAALRKTNTQECWGDMAGPLWWVSTVACPASHLPDGMVRSQKDDLAKKWFIMTAIRTNAITSRNGHDEGNNTAMRNCFRVLAAVSRPG